MQVFATLGPSGSNHDYVARRYLAFHGLEGAARVELFPAFRDAFEALFSGRADYILQAAVHPDAARSVAIYRDRAPLIDTFLSASQPMALIVRRKSATSDTLGLQMATRDYIDTTRWAKHVPERTTIDVAHGLLAGKYDAGITLCRFAEEHPEILEVKEAIGEILDPWLVFARTPTPSAGCQIWPDSPAAQRYRANASP